MAWWNYAPARIIRTEHSSRERVPPVNQNKQLITAFMSGVYATFGFMLGAHTSESELRRRDERGMSTIEIAMLIGVVVVVATALVFVITRVAAKYTAKIN